MSSSGLIYAGIVGAWAVYLVPVWLRREEQLNEARKKARYAAAIRTLGRTERFERRWLPEEALAATGTDGPVRPPSAEPAKPAKPAKAAKPGGRPNTGSDSGPGSSAKSTKSAAPTSAKKPGGSPATRPQPAAGPTPTEEPGVWRPAPAPAATMAAQQRRHGVSARIPHPHERQQPQAHQVRHRGVLLMRRRRVVAFLFTLATVGAAVSAVLGLAYIWAMLVPATLFSVYIFNIRRDERLRAEERYRRRQAALAAERRRERQRQQAEAAANAAAVQQPRRREPSRPQNPARGMPQEPPQDFRRAANG